MTYTPKNIKMIFWRLRLKDSSDFDLHMSSFRVVKKFAALICWSVQIRGIDHWKGDWARSSHQKKRGRGEGKREEGKEEKRGAYDRHQVSFGRSWWHIVPHCEGNSNDVAVWHYAAWTSLWFVRSQIRACRSCSYARFRLRIVTFENNVKSLQDISQRSLSCKHP